MVDFCSSCGKELKEGADFCSYCGTTVDSSKSENMATNNNVSTNEVIAPKDYIVSKEETSSKEKIASSVDDQKAKDNKNLLIAISLVGVCCIGLILIVALGGMFIPDANTDEYNSDYTDYYTYTPSVTVDTSLSENEYKAACQNINFKVLEKNPYKYYGDKVKYSGRVVEISEYDGLTQIRLATDGYYDDIVYVLYDGTTPAVEEDYITIWGEVKGTYTYISQANYQITLPQIDARFISLN